MTNKERAQDLTKWLYGVSPGVDDEQIKFALKEAMDEAVKQSQSEPWPEDRRKQIEDLGRLISILKGLNKGSGFLDKIQEAMALAESLDKANIYARKKRFTAFLEQRSWGKES